MKKFTFIAIAVLLSFSTAFSQVDSFDYCGTEDVDSAQYFEWPWFGNNDFLVDFQDSLDNTGQEKPGPGLHRTTATNNGLYYIPVIVFIHHSGATIDNLDIGNAELIINETNRIFENNGSKIRLFVNCTYFNKYNSQYANLTSSTAGIMWNQYYVHNMMNIHFVKSSKSLGASYNSFNGIARLPWKNNPYALAIVNEPIFSISQLGTVLAHETGHTLGLLHTQFSGIWREIQL